MLAQDLRTPQERNRYNVALAVSALFWIAVVVSIIGAVYGVIIAAFLLCAHALLIAHLTGNGVRVGSNQLPHLWRRVEAASHKLGLAQPPETYVVQSGGVLNAFATKLLSRRFVVLYSDLVDACELRNPSLDQADARATELDFILGHEIGHIACNHLNWQLLPARLVPLLGAAYSRACEYTCDACGHAVTGDIDVSTRALAILAGGPIVAQRIDLEAFAGQRSMASGFWAGVYELNASHPYLPKRVAALLERERPGWAPMPDRNPLAYPLAPLFGLGAGGAGPALAVVAVVGILAAVAVPAFVKFQERAKEAQQVAQAREQRRNADVLQEGLGAGVAEQPADAKPKEEAQEWLRGDTFTWRLKVPGPAWREVPTAMARKQNPLADRWITRPDVDAHLLVIGEAAPGTKLDQFVETVVANGKTTSPAFELLEQKPLLIGMVDGRLLHTRAKLGELDIEYLYGLVLHGDQAFQIVAFASKDKFPSVQAEMQRAIASFELK